MKNAAIIVLALVALAVTVTSYRAYRNRAERELESRRAMIAERDEEARRRAVAEQEAQRLAALQAEQEAADAARQIAELRAQEEAAAARRAAADAEVLRLQAELERLRRESEEVIAETQRLAASRPNELAAVAAAREEALERLKTLEQEKSDLADRQAVHAAALQLQLAKEKEAQERVARYQASRPR